MVEIGSQAPEAPTGEQAFAQVLGRLVDRSQLTLDEIRERLLEAGCRVSKASLSYWRTGQSVPSRPSSLRVIDELERVLNAPLGQLRAALPSNAFALWDPVVALPFDDQVRATLLALGLPETPFDNHIDVFVQDSITVLGNGCDKVERTRQLIEAHVPGLQHLPIVFRHHFDEAPLPFVEAGRGCELARVVELDDAQLVLLDFVLPRPLARGERHCFDYSFTWHFDPRPPQDGLMRVQLQLMELYSIDLTFAGDLPRSLEWRTAPYEVNEPQAPDDLVQSLEVTRRTELSMTDMPAGKYVLTWDW